MILHRDVDVVVFRRGGAAGNSGGGHTGQDAGTTEIKPNPMHSSKLGDKNRAPAASMPSFVSPDSATVRRWLAKKQDRQAVDIPRFETLNPKS